MSSKYQSQKICHTNLYISFAASLNLYSSKYKSIFFSVSIISETSQFVTGFESLDIFSFLTFKQLFNSQNLAAFHNFVPKFLYPSTLDSDNFISLPYEAIDANVNLSESAPKLSINFKGSTTLPLDLDIF